MIFNIFILFFEKIAIDKIFIINLMIIIIYLSHDNNRNGKSNLNTISLYLLIFALIILNKEQIFFSKSKSNL